MKDYTFEIKELNAARRHVGITKSLPSNNQKWYIEMREYALSFYYNTNENTLNALAYFLTYKTAVAINQEKKNPAEVFHLLCNKRFSSRQTINDVILRGVTEWKPSEEIEYLSPTQELMALSGNLYKTHFQDIFGGSSNFSGDNVKDVKPTKSGKNKSRKARKKQKAKINKNKNSKTTKQSSKQALNNFNRNSNKTKTKSINLNSTSNKRYSKTSKVYNVKSKGGNKAKIVNHSVYSKSISNDNLKKLLHAYNVNLTRQQIISSAQFSAAEKLINSQTSMNSFIRKKR